MPSSYDVVVVGAGNAALCAALAARESGVSVLVLECAPEAERGGNSRFTAGAMRVAYNGVDDLARLMPDLTDEDKARTDFGAYTEDQFFDDLAASLNTAPAPSWPRLLVRRSFETMMWMRTKGVRFQPIYGRQAFNVGGRFKFWGGLTVEAWGGGPGLIDALHAGAAHHGIEVWYQSRALELEHDDNGVTRRRGPARGTHDDRRSQGGGARRGRLRGQRRVAHALPRSRMGSGQGARHAL